MANINQRLNGLEPLAYAGVNAVQPPDFVTKPRPPTSTDSKNFYLGQIWLDTGTNTPPTANDVYMLVALLGNQATWVSLSGGNLETLTGNSGGAVSPDGASNINVVGDGTYIDIVGNPGTNTLTASLVNGGSYAQLFQADVGTATPLAGQLNILGANGIQTFGAGQTITITAPSTPPFVTWADVSGTSQAMAVNTGYTANNAGLVTLTLPATAAYGSVFYVVGKGSGGWSIAQNAGQTIHFGMVNTTTGGGGSLSSTKQYDTVAMVCSIANTDFTVLQSIGDITYV